MRTTATHENIMGLAARPLLKRIEDGSGLSYLSKLRAAISAGAAANNTTLSALWGFSRYSPEIRFGDDSIPRTTAVAVIEWGESGTPGHVSDKKQFLGAALTGLDERIFPYYTRAMSMTTGTRSLHYPTFVRMVNREVSRVADNVPLIIALTDSTVDLPSILSVWNISTRRLIMQHLVKDVLNARSNVFSWAGNPFLSDYYIRQADRIPSLFPELGELLPATTDLDTKIRLLSKELAEITKERETIVSRIMEQF